MPLDRLRRAGAAGDVGLPQALDEAAEGLARSHLADLPARPGNDADAERRLPRSRARGPGLDPRQPSPGQTGDAAVKIGALRLFDRGDRDGRHVVASWCSAHSLTWRWTLSFHIWRNDAV